MHSIRLAEWILGIVTAPERAASTAGDLAERRITRGCLWFWHAAFRTVASLAWSGIVARPGHVAGLAFLGAIFALVAGFLYAFFSGLMFWYTDWYGLHIQWQPPFGAIMFNMPLLITSLFVGRMLARWAIDREVAACLVYIFLMPALSLLTDPPEGFGVWGVIAIFLQSAALQIPALAGGIWGRRRRVRFLRARHIEA